MTILALIAALSISCDDPGLCFTSSDGSLDLSKGVPSAYVPDAADPAAAGKSLRVTRGTAAFLCSLLSGWYERGLAFIGNGMTSQDMESLRAALQTENLGNSWGHGLDFMGAIGASSCAYINTNRTVTAASLFRLGVGDLTRKMAGTFCGRFPDPYGLGITSVQPSCLDLEKNGGMPFPTTDGAWKEMDMYADLFPANAYLKIWRDWTFVPGVAPTNFVFYVPSTYRETISDIGRAVSRDFLERNPRRDAIEMPAYPDYRELVDAGLPNVYHVLTNYCGRFATDLTNETSRLSYGRLNALSWLVALSDRQIVWRHGLEGILDHTTNTYCLTMSSTKAFGSDNVSFAWKDAPSGTVELHVSSPSSGWEEYDVINSVKTNSVRNEEGAVFACAADKFASAHYTGSLSFLGSLTDPDALKELAPSNGVWYRLTSRFVPRERRIEIMSSAGAQRFDVPVKRTAGAVSASATGTREVTISTPTETDESAGTPVSDSSLWRERLGFVREIDGYLIGSLSETRRDYSDDSVYAAKPPASGFPDDKAAFRIDLIHASTTPGYRAVWRGWRNEVVSEARSRFANAVGVRPDSPEVATPTAVDVSCGLTNVVIDVGSEPVDIQLTYPYLMRSDDAYYLRTESGAAPYPTEDVPVTLTFGIARSVSIGKCEGPYSCTVGLGSAAGIKYRFRNMRADGEDADTPSP